MTNGEKMQEVFPEGKTRRCINGVVLESDGWCHAYDSDWWNAEYKEPTTKNCESCRYYGSHHEACNYCYECSLWTEGEPITKNDLGVDCISRAEALALYCDKCGLYNCISKCASYRAVEKMPSVTPQPRKGHWIVQPSNKEQGERDFIWWKCSECGQVIFSETEKDRKEFHAFCGRCGAYMREVEE